MEPSIFRYIWANTRREQVVILLIVLVSMIPYYLAFDLPKQIVNGPIQGSGFEGPSATQPFLRIAPEIPWIGEVVISPGIPLERLPLLMALSLAFLSLVIINGAFKFVINTYKGRMGERLLRRIRFELVDRILRFPPQRFRQLKAGEVSSMVKDEVEPIGGFSGDAFVQPALLGGQALTALVFIFMQHFWLGCVACGMAMVQVAIIPRMRRRLIVLGRERQLTARELAGRVADIVEGISTIHANDTTNWERADISHRLGRIFRIRYDIYQWKFFVKWLNNFLAQLTPFLFYSIGGYLTIRGSLDVGQLVAVINAYKELPGPLKELIDWDLARQDMQVKYEQVVEQFEAEEMIDPARHAPDAPAVEGALAPLAVRGLTVTTDVGTALIEDVSFEIAPGETAALVGGTADGAPVLGEVLGGMQRIAHGHVQLGGHDIEMLPEAVTGRMLSYVTASGYLFSGTLLDNITYGLRHRPGPDDGADERSRRDPARRSRAWERREALRAGNPDFDIETDWIDPASVQPPPGDEGLIGSVAEVLRVTGLDSDVFDFAMRSVIPADRIPGIDAHALTLRRAFYERLTDRGLGHLVLRFDPEHYNSEATIGENLFFGVPDGGLAAIRTVVQHPFFREIIAINGLAEELFALGWQFASLTVDMFRGLEDNPDLLQWLTYMSPEELPMYEQLLARVDRGSFIVAQNDDRRTLIKLAFSYVEPRYRFGLLTEELRGKIIAARHRLHRKMPPELQPLIQPYEPDTYLVSASLQENILFGKVNQRVGNADAKLREIGRELLRENRDLHLSVLEVGLMHQIGPGGRRLGSLQRQRVGLARALVRRSKYYVMNEPLAGADAALQDRLIEKILAFLGDQPEPPAVLWVLANAQLAHHFGRRIEFSQGRVRSSAGDHVDDGHSPLRTFDAAS
ncbi:ABC transporter transmembrane domain-containing protein [Frigidibacter sp. MR17.24]|uniref:ABC transporter transmembrane domain-containing protein n=1 Tax=Frigidibacter sp. MR17.24 TaxID=3127345 RepID=UPI003012CD76